MRLTATALLIAAAAAALTYLLPTSIHAQPEVTETSPQDGDVLPQPPEAIRLCFSESVLIEDSKDYSFSVIPPGGSALGLRIVFQPDGLGVQVFPGVPQGKTEGEWTFDWEVTAISDGEKASGTISFTVREGGTPAPPAAAAEPCGGSPAPAPTPTPEHTPAPTGENGDGLNTEAIALIVAGAVAGAALIAFAVYMVRQQMR